MILDTNVIVRHFTGDPPAQARAATRLFGSGRRLQLTDVVAAECVFVLEGVYDLARSEVARLMRALVSHPTIETESGDRLLTALAHYAGAGLDFADAYLVAISLHTGQPIASFDRDLARRAAVEIVRPR